MKKRMTTYCIPSKSHKLFYFDRIDRLFRENSEVSLRYFTDDTPFTYPISLQLETNSTKPEKKTLVEFGDFIDDHFSTIISALQPIVEETD